MSIHPSLKTAGSLDAKRSVLKRTERLEKLAATKGFDAEKKPALGLPKTSTKTGGAH
ncbi:MAG: small basic protein [Phycisphaerales bacterium]|nr:small basic protein [Phycisphaerales bacterium]